MEEAMKKFTFTELRALTTDQLIAVMREISGGLASHAFGPADREEALAILAHIRTILAERRQAKRLTFPTP
jgi:hypothetical protein